MNQSVLLFLLVTFSFHPKKGTTLASPTGNLPGKYSNRVVALGQSGLFSNSDVAILSEGFSYREEHCMAEPEFCSTFVKELGVSNLISICKVRKVMFV